MNEPVFTYQPRQLNKRAGQAITITAHYGSPLFDWDAHFEDGTSFPIHDDEVE
jgi:hypothetical protein